MAHFSVTRDFSRINAFLFFPILLCRECAETHPYSKFSKVLVSNGSFILHADWTSRELRGERLNWTSFHIFHVKERYKENKIAKIMNMGLVCGNRHYVITLEIISF